MNKRVFKIGEYVRFSREKNLNDEGCIFVSLYGNSEAMLGKDTKETRMRLARQLREIARELERVAR